MSSLLADEIADFASHPGRPYSEQDYVSRLQDGSLLSVADAEGEDELRYIRLH